MGGDTISRIDRLFEIYKSADEKDRKMVMDAIRFIMTVEEVPDYAM